MLKLLGWVFKTAIFAAVILVLGNVVHWRGHTVSDQVKTQLSHAERLAEAYNPLPEETPAPKVRAPSRLPVKSTANAESPAARSAPERIAPSERQKLRALIRELNGARAKKVTDNL